MCLCARACACTRAAEWDYVKKKKTHVVFDAVKTTSFVSWCDRGKQTKGRE